MRSKSVEQIGLGFDLTVANGIQPEQCFFLLYLHDKRWKLLLLIGYLETVLLLKSSRASFSLFMALPGTGAAGRLRKIWELCTPQGYSHLFHSLVFSTLGTDSPSLAGSFPLLHPISGAFVS